MTQVTMKDTDSDILVTLARAKEFPYDLQQLGLKRRKTILTAAQIKLLADPAIELVPAVAGKVLVFVGASYKLVYGSETFAEPSAPDDLIINYVDKDGDGVSDTQDAGAIIVGTADAYAVGIPIAVAGGALAARVNVPLVLWNSGSNYTGNASNDSTLEVTVWYREADVA